MLMCVATPKELVKRQMIDPTPGGSDSVGLRFTFSGAWISTF